MNNKPIHEIRFSKIRAAIWENRTTAGKPIYNVTFSRLYRDGERWKDSTSFSRGDLLLLGKLADAVHTWFLEVQEQTRLDC